MSSVLTSCGLVLRFSFLRHLGGQLAAWCGQQQSPGRTEQTHHLSAPCPRSRPDPSSRSSQGSAQATQAQPARCTDCVTVHTHSCPETQSIARATPRARAMRGCRAVCALPRRPSDSVQTACSLTPPSRAPVPSALVCRRASAQPLRLGTAAALPILGLVGSQHRALP